MKMSNSFEMMSVDGLSVRIMSSLDVEIRDRIFLISFYDVTAGAWGDPMQLGEGQAFWECLQEAWKTQLTDDQPEVVTLTLSNHVQVNLPIGHLEMARRALFGLTVH